MLGKRKQDPKAHTLGELSLFRGCTEAELGRLAGLFDETSAPAGKALIAQGRPGRGFFVIEQGLASVSIDSRPVATIGPGDFFGEMSLLERAPTTATVTAKTDLALFVLDKRSFGLLLQDAPSLAQKMLEVISRRLRVAEEAPSDFSSRV